MGQGMAEAHPHRHQGRPNGTNATEIQSESGQNVGGRRDFIRVILAAALRDLCPDQVRRRDRKLGGRGAANRHTDSSVVRSLELLH